LQRQRFAKIKAVNAPVAMPTTTQDIRISLANVMISSENGRTTLAFGWSFILRHNSIPKLMSASLSAPPVFVGELYTGQ
jgi:hypothetical protein